MSFWVSYSGLQCETDTGSEVVQYLYYDDGVDYWRKGVRDGKFVYDKTLTPLGFGVGSYQNIDWEEVNSIAKP